MSGPECGRLHCVSCKRWRHRVDFGVIKWADHRRTVVRKHKTQCNPCLRRYHRRRLEDPRARKAMYESIRRYRERERRAVELAKPKPLSTPPSRGPWTEEQMRNARVAIESFRPHWDAIIRVARQRFVSSEDKDATSNHRRKSINGTFDAMSFQIWLGITKQEYDLITHNLAPSRTKKTGESSQTLDYYLCDKVLTGAGMPQKAFELYVVPKSGKSTVPGMLAEYAFG